MIGMKKLLYYFLCSFLIISSVWSCRYDDEDIWKELQKLKTQLLRLNNDISTLQGLVEALQKSKIISEVTRTDLGYSLDFTDGTSLSITNGIAGKDAPVIGIGLFEGIYYWTLGGAKEWLRDSEGNKLPVTAKDGHSPQLAVDTNGFWTVDGERITDPNGQTVKAVGKDGKNGDSFFASVEDGKNEVTIKLADGTLLTLPKIGNESFAFIRERGEEQNYFFTSGEERQIKLSMAGITAIDKIHLPEGWIVDLDFDNHQVTVKASESIEPGGGIITLVGITESGATLFASAEVCSVNYADPQGTFVVCEGNMATVNGMLVYYDRNGKEYMEVFEKANGGKEIGNVVQDMYMANGKIYLITQNGDSRGGAGRFVVCNAQTMKMEYADPLIIKTPEGKEAWPQHIAVVDKDKAYVQYAEAGMELTSGICSLKLGDNSVTVENTVEGTFGRFASEGATKSRMVLSKGKLFIGCGCHVAIINASTGKVEKKIDYPGQQVKGMVKAADGNIYFCLAAPFKGDWYAPVFTGHAQIVGIDHQGIELQRTDMPESIRIPVASWSPAVGMCASFNAPYLYFIDTDEFVAKTATRYNYVTDAFEVNYIKETVAIYGIMGVHPVTEELWVAASDFISSDIYVYDTKSNSPAELRHFKYPSQKGASPAGVDFAYRFSKEFIDK